MSDTWRENAIVEAIQIIADKRISQAGYDKTIKGTVNKLLDKTIGKYEIKYQDSLFQAFASSADINYEQGETVSILIPGNDMTATKSIISGSTKMATTYQQIPIVSQQFNNVGPSGISLIKNIELSSYQNNFIEISEDNQSEYGSFNDIAKYVKTGDSLTLSMMVRTALAPSQQINGRYGVTFYLKFKDNTTTDPNAEPIIQQITIDTSDVIGNPYGLVKETLVQSGVPHINNLQDFLGISKIVAFCRDFPEDLSKDINDIFISQIGINGAEALTQTELDGYVLHLDYSEKGNTLPVEGKNIEQPDKVSIKAQLKVKGKEITSNVKYYWFRQNGTIFKGSKGKYSSYAGDGWQCLNYFNQGVPIGIDTPYFYFDMTDEDKPDSYTAGTLQKVTKVLCVAVYNGSSIKSKQIQIVNNTIKQIIITSSDRTSQDQNRVIYYLNNGSPNLICSIPDIEMDSTYSYIWSVRPSRGQIEKKEETTQKNIQYNQAKTAYDQIKSKADKMAESDRKVYVSKQFYKQKQERWNNIKDAQRIEQNKYINFPVGSIFNYSTISCAVLDGEGKYLGTGSITLYNKMQIEGMYSLNLEYGTQVFQYDDKGNSPTSPQLEKKLEIHPLAFALTDNEGKQIPYEQILANDGWVKWIIPTKQTLLISEQTDGYQGNLDLTVLQTNLPLDAKDYYVYPNRESFNYNIQDRYDSKNNINYIWLCVKYKDLVLNTYTDFSFPKDGDPGTNGTDYVAKINIGDSDRVYISSLYPNQMFDDKGADVDSLKFQVYNNSKITSLTANYWTTPPKSLNSSSGSSQSNVSPNRKGYLAISSSTGESIKVSLRQTSKTLEKVEEDKPINIVRGQYGSGTGQGSLKYFAQIPVCTNYIKAKEGNNNQVYRIKVKPKTGFSYVVYTTDGTSPDYDNTMPFEIIVEKQVYDEESATTYFSTDVETYVYSFDVIGNLKKPSTNFKTNNTCVINPKDTFDGQDLSSAVVCNVYIPEFNEDGTVKKDEKGKIVIKNGKQIGFIHIPIYMIINRYNNRALNGWDGNSVQIDKSGNGQILTPQIAAGQKNEDNSFTGMIMGKIALNSSDSSIGENGDVGLMGYHTGQRTIFLDSKTGKAQFGKNNAAKIILDPSQQMNEKDVAFLYSNGFKKDLYKKNNGEVKKNNTYGQGLMIDLTSPAIQFGSGHFYVSSSGDIHAGGNGDIAGWNIDDNKIYKHTNKYVTGMISSSDPAFYAGTTAQDSISPSSTAAYNFFVNHNGYLYSKSGKIASWNINEKNLSNSKVGMGVSEKDIIFSYGTASVASTSHISASSTIKAGDARFWSDNTFIVDKQGKLYSNSAQIGPWSVTKDQFTNGNVGLGINTISSGDMNDAFGVSDSINAKIWGSSSNSNSNINFAVSADGKLYSKAGKIGGWNIGKNMLWAGSTAFQHQGIRIKANGSMDGGEGYSPSTSSGGHWSINTDGSSSFQNVTTNRMKATDVDATNIVTHNITANDGGTVGGWTIGEKTLSSEGIIINSTGSINNGSNWSITSGGDAYFKNIYGTVKDGNSLSSSGGGAGTGGGWTLPGSSGGVGQFGGPSGVSQPRPGKLINNLTLSVYNLGEFYVPTRYTSNVTFVTGATLTKDPTTGAVTNVTLSTSSGYLITGISGSMEKITKTWGSKTSITPTLDIMVSTSVNQEVQDE